MTTLRDELAYLSVTELAQQIRSRQLSPVEVIDATIERIEQRDPDLNAFVHRGFDEARDRACKAEAAVMRGAELGPLHGVPTAMKDLFDFKPGWPSTFGGIRALAGTVIDASCVFVERVERDGAIVVGKTNSPVMGFRGTCDNLLFGPTRNPFDLTRNAGGSSGGSAAAVADGLVPFAEGTDAGGSIRIPAAWCGTFGMKASFGRVPVVIRPNAYGGTDPFVAEGPITRTVADAALVLQTLSGPDVRDPTACRTGWRWWAPSVVTWPASASGGAPTLASTPWMHGSPRSSSEPSAGSRPRAPPWSWSRSRSRTTSGS